MRTLPLRKLKAKMEIKALSLRDVATRSGVPYNTCSLILNGRFVDPEYLRRIKKAINDAPMPEEAVA